MTQLHSGFPARRTRASEGWEGHSGLKPRATPLSYDLNPGAAAEMLAVAGIHAEAAILNPNPSTTGWELCESH